MTEATNTFYIYFWGLICHVAKDKQTKNEKEHAALVRTDTDDSPGSHAPKIVFSDGTEAEVFDNVSFGGHGPATFDPDFTAYVASLAELIGQNTDLKGSVYAASTEEAYNCFYPRQTRLSVANLYDHVGIYSVDGTPRPARLVARIVLGTVRTKATSLRVRYKNDEGWQARDLTPEDNCLLIANAERRPDSLDDARNYRRLIDTPADLTADDGAEQNHQVEFVGCRWVLDYVNNASRLRFKAASSTECGNTQWP